MYFRSLQIILFHFCLIPVWCLVMMSESYAQTGQCADVFHLSDSCMKSFLGKTPEEVLSGFQQRPNVTYFSHTLGSSQRIIKIEFTFHTISKSGDYLTRYLYFSISRPKIDMNLIPPQQKAFADSLRSDRVYYYPTDTLKIMKNYIISSLVCAKACECFSPTRGCVLLYTKNYVCVYRDSLEKRCSLVIDQCRVLDRSEAVCRGRDWCFSPECTTP